MTLFHIMVIIIFIKFIYKLKKVKFSIKHSLFIFLQIKNNIVFFRKQIYLIYEVKNIFKKKQYYKYLVHLNIESVSFIQ
jgi:hypothetical protein